MSAELAQMQRDALVMPPPTWGSADGSAVSAELAVARRMAPVVPPMGQLQATSSKLQEKTNTVEPQP